ncbi:MAG: multidrug efflux SMR transporter [Methanobacteriaceae archaeon]|nr:multidrug efflux SMR transporter [Methanobacteriaceae archaeon]
MNSWIYLLIAGIFEILWVTSLKFSNSFSKIIPSILTIIFMIASLLFLSYSFKSINMGTAYACWTGIGAVGAIIVGILFFKEITSTLQIGFLVMIIIGIVGLKLTSV